MSKWFGKRNSTPKPGMVGSVTLDDFGDSSNGNFSLNKIGSDTLDDFDNNSNDIDKIGSDALDDFDKDSDDSFALIDAPTTPNRTSNTADAAPVPISSDEDLILPKVTTQWPLTTQATPATAIETSLAETNFLAMTEPSAADVANTKIQILHQQRDLAEDRIATLKLDMQALLQGHKAERDEQDRKREVQDQVVREKVHALSTGHFAMLHRSHAELRRRENDCRVEVEKLQRSHGVEVQGGKKKYEDEVVRLEREHDAEILCLKETHGTEAEARLLAVQKDHESMLAALRNQIEELKLQQTSELQTLERTHCSDIGTLKQQCNTQVEDAVSAYNDKSAEIRRHHTSEIAELKTAHENKVFAITQTHKAEVDELGSRLAAENDALEQEVEASRRQAMKERDHARVVTSRHHARKPASPPFGLPDICPAPPSREAGLTATQVAQGYGRARGISADMTYKMHLAHRAKGQWARDCGWCMSAGSGYYGH
ncbi:hypothetical protein LTR08_000851 [Meristemomyces frigidus]|nr:hypothetical protein LTR08_000851 [Meristemomyces frigidus]